MCRSLFNALFKIRYEENGQPVVCNQNLVFDLTSNIDIENVSKEVQKQLLLELLKREAAKIGKSYSKLEIVEIYSIKQAIENVKRD